MGTSADFHVAACRYEARVGKDLRHGERHMRTLAVLCRMASIAVESGRVS